MTYDYVCTRKKCGHVWEVEQSIKADPLTECPKCKKESAKRQISGGGFILVGQGWFNSGGY